MLNVPVYDESGKQIGDEQIDEALLGGRVNPALLKQAVVMYHANRRQGDAAQKTRAEVVGSSRKIFRQKGTGRARLAKIQGSDALIVDGLKFDEPKTKRLVALLGALQADRGCVFATNGIDAALLKSGRNIPRANIMNVGDLNARDILTRRRLVFTRDAFETFRQIVATPVKAGD